MKLLLKSVALALGLDNPAPVGKPITQVARDLGINSGTQAKSQAMERDANRFDIARTAFD